MFAVELALEFRHNLKGYNTPLFGKPALLKNDHPSGKAHSSYGPTSSYPFRSKILTKKKEGSIRFWIASASHAAHTSMPIESIFPNRICSAFGSGCEVINGSKAGNGIKDNIKLIGQYAVNLESDYVVLYQMSMIIEGQQKSLSQHVDVSKAEEAVGIFDIVNIQFFLQKTSLYIHLTDYIGGNIKLEGILKNGFPSTMDVDFERQVMIFVDACRDLGLKPVLVTFAASHNQSNIEQMPASVKTNFVRYNNYLSVNGWLNTVHRYNEFLREVSKRESVPLIDLEAEINGRPEYFVDFVHFNQKGHARVAKIIGEDLNLIVRRVRL